MPRPRAQLRQRQSAARDLQSFAEFAAIEFTAHQREIQALRLEKQRLEEQSDPIRLLKKRLAEAESRFAAQQASRDEAVASERALEKEIADGERLIDKAKQTLRQHETDGSLAVHAESFVNLAACFADTPLTTANLFVRELAFKDSRRASVDGLRRELAPLHDELCAEMNRFLREFREEQVDLDARAESLDSFLALREHIRREDLPRHEHRFKERLNEKVTQDISLLNAELMNEGTDIEGRIDVLNQSLRQLEYRRGTHMRLEPRPVRDREIAEFQQSLKECLAGTFEGTFAADEARFVRIEKFISRLREDPRWRDKVTDVRRWFDFVARELDDATDQERSYFEDSTGQSGGEKAKLAFTILVAAIAYQFNLDPTQPQSNRFQFVVVDEMFSKVDDQHAEYALELFQKFGLQLLIVAPLDAKARVTEPYVGCYLHVVKDEQTSHSEIFSMTARQFEVVVDAAMENQETRSDLVTSAPQRPR